ncbi:hypothetical protein L1049_024176 [Liquidambar formosana]|uniref:GBF-interacting protein 1 N-terminal domain-containing protein n=1 Tax=Liquidambar formosana TaxID=63359 RepID=A0AAP0WYC0_LIQFO
MSSGGSKNGSGGGGGGGGLAAIPVASRKIVQGLKEIVNCPEQEIYAMLKECNMDPNDTVHKLLCQDTFHEVKSKRDRRKELKDTHESRPRVISTGSNRNVKGGGSERNVGRSGQTQISSYELGKPAYKGENGSVAPLLSSSSTPRTAGQTVNHLTQSHSNFVSAANKGWSIDTSDAIASSAQETPGFQSSWSGAPGHVSMADIVRLGRLQSKASSTPIMSTETSYSPHDSVAPNSSHDYVKRPQISAPLVAESHQDSWSQNPVSNVSESINEPGISAGQHVYHEEWPVIDKPAAASGSSVLDASAVSDAEIYPYPSNSHSSRANVSQNYQPDDVQVSDEDVAFKNYIAEHNGSASVSSRQIMVDSADKKKIMVDSAGGVSQLDNDSLKVMRSYHSHGQTFDHQEVSEAAANFQGLSLGEDMTVLPTEDDRAVVIPNHLQVSAADCSHLSFGTFKSGTVSGSVVSNPLEEVSPVTMDGSSLALLDTRILEYHGDLQLRSTSDAHRVTPDARNYDSPVSSQPELMKQVIPAATHVHQVTFPSSVPGYNIENRHQPGSALSYAQPNPQFRDLSTFTSAMHAYSNSPPSNLLASTVQSLRESDLPYSPFLAAQSMPSRYSSAVSSINSPTMSEVLKAGTFSVPQPTSLSLPGTNVATGPALPQNLSVHSYSQPALPMGHSANMMGYPLMPQSFTYLPSAYQEAYPGSSAFHQSLAALESAGLKYTHPQYRSSASVSGLTQSAANASGYGGFGNSTNIPGSFLQNSSTTPTGTTIGYDDLLSSYRDGNHFIPHQQNESSATSGYGPSSRTLPNISAGAYYALQGQNQQHAGYRQGQQSSQHYGGLGYSNYVHSQTGITQEHQQQSPSDANFSGIQGPSSKQSHQLWQHSY